MSHLTSANHPSSDFFPQEAKQPFESKSFNTRLIYLFKMFKLMDVDGDKYFSVDDMEEISQTVSIDHRMISTTDQNVWRK